MKKRLRDYTILNKRIVAQQSDASADVLTSPQLSEESLSSNEFRFLPNVHVTLPEPEAWMNPKAERSSPIFAGKVVEGSGFWVG